MNLNLIRDKYNNWFGLGFLFALSVALSILAIPNSTISFLILGGLFAVLFLVLSILKPELVIYCAILLSGFTGSLSFFRTDLFPFSFSGLFTGFILLSSTLVLLFRIKFLSTIKAIKAYWHFYPFLFLVLIRAIFGPILFDGMKLFFLILVPILVGIVARREILRKNQVRLRVERALLFIPLLPITILLINLFSGGLQVSNLGFTTVIGLGLGPRPLALLFLPLLALMVSKWRYTKKTSEKVFTILGSIALTAIIVTSLSRVASVIALVIVLPFRFIKKWYHPATVFTITLGVGLMLYWISLPSVQMRFFPEGISSIKFDLTAIQIIDTQGRRNLWALTWTSAIESPLIGSGTGTAGQLVNSTYPPLEHPHNDYLRVFHDLGIIGLIAFVFAWLIQINHNLKNWRVLDKNRNLGAYYHLAALVGTIAISLSFLTDNTLTYVFVLIPLNIIYGLADAANFQDPEFSSLIP